MKRSRRPSPEGLGARLWFELPIGPNIWCVWLADPAECHVLDGAEGVTVHRESCIYLDETLEISRLCGVLGHELVHVSMTNLNVEAEAALYGIKPDHEAVRCVQERLACQIGPAIIDGLQRAGVLKLPRLPK